MPADPVMRARARLYLYNFEKDLFNHIKDIESGEDERVERARKVIRDNLTQLVPIFSKQNYLMGDEYSMLDVAITPLLWRLGHYGIELPNQAAPLLKYAERLFSRPMYAEAMTPSEKAMRK
jgi:RNA polymerase-associated protein